MGNSAQSGGITIQALGSVPVGTIIPWPTETVPLGYKECNGASLLRADYAELFAVISTMYGAADSTHFNLPDYRGRFLRAWDNSHADDPDRASRTVPSATGATLSAGDHVGTEQGDDYKAHRHYMGSGVNTAGAGAFLSPQTDNAGYQTSTMPSSGGNETRGKNVYVMYCIKYTMEVFSFVDAITKGAANLKFFMNAGATAPEWAKGLQISAQTRDLTAASGDVSYTGVGFKPSFIIFLVGRATTSISMGVSDTSTHKSLFSTYGVTNSVLDAAFVISVDGANYQSAIVKSMDSDGFTLTWTKTSSPTGTGVVTAICFR